MTKPLALRLEENFYDKMLSYHFKDYKRIHKFKDQIKINGFDEYNFLLDINACFSTKPSGNVLDRTNTVKNPVNFKILRPWAEYQPAKTLDECFRLRVLELCSQNKNVHLFWSGGIDSTSMLVGFLKHCPNLSQIKVIHSPASIKENPAFYMELTEHPEIEMIDFSGDVYLTQQLNGIFVSADVADDITASMDDSFFELVGYKGLFKPWDNFIYDMSKSSDLVDFYKAYTSQCNIPINNVLEAKWWFYTVCKIQKFPPALASLLNDDQPVPLGFYDTIEFETYTAHNINNLLANKNYNSYKQFLKDYIFEYHKNEVYQKYKTKVNSGQMAVYAKKKMALHSSVSIGLLEDGTRIRTKNLPFLTEKDYRHTYGDSLNYLFNT